MSKTADAAEQMLFEIRKTIDKLERGETESHDIITVSMLSASVLALQSATTLRTIADMAAQVTAKADMFELFMARYFASSLNAKNEFQSFSEVCLRAASASKDPERYEATEKSLARLDEIWQLIEGSGTYEQSGLIQ